MAKEFENGSSLPSDMFRSTLTVRLRSKVCAWGADGSSIYTPIMTAYLPDGTEAHFCIEKVDRAYLRLMRYMWWRKFRVRRNANGTWKLTAVRTGNDWMKILHPGG